MDGAGTRSYAKQLLRPRWSSKMSWTPLKKDVYRVVNSSNVSSAWAEDACRTCCTPWHCCERHCVRAVTATTGTGRAAGQSARAMEDDGVRSRCIVLFYENGDNDGRQGDKVVVEKKPGEVETGLVPTPDPTQRPRNRSRSLVNVMLWEYSESIVHVRASVRGTDMSQSETAYIRTSPWNVIIVSPLIVVILQTRSVQPSARHRGIYHLRRREIKMARWAIICLQPPCEFKRFLAQGLRK